MRIDGPDALAREAEGLPVRRRLVELPPEDAVVERTRVETSEDAERGDAAPLQTKGLEKTRSAVERRSNPLGARTAALRGPRQGNCADARKKDSEAKLRVSYRASFHD
jgi:hypothetical protein